MSVRFETNAPIVGAGPAGLGSALFLSEYGVENILLEKYGWTAHTPRAHITNQRPMEIPHDMGLEEDVVERRSETFSKKNCRVRRARPTFTAVHQKGLEYRA